MTVPTFREYLQEQEAIDVFHQVRNDLFQKFPDLPPSQHQELAKNHALQKLIQQYEQKYDVTDAGGPKSISDIFRTLE